MIGSSGGLAEPRERVKLQHSNIYNFGLRTGYFWFVVNSLQKDIFVVGAKPGET